MPKITINGKELDFNPGQTVIEVATQNNIPIPHFCWHPNLSVSGNCRMCLVDIEKMPKLAIACATLAADGMVVNVDTEKAVKARNSVMEFILINHPLDCPICDEAGECKLQDYTYKYSAGESRFDEEKTHNRKRVELGPHVMLDNERCISCSRCIRFCDEIAGQKQLTFVKRGDRVTITTFPGMELDNPYSLNVTDICPVGALTNRDFRFKSRVWEMSKTSSVCTGCSRGCNDEIWVRNNEVLRLTPRENKEVNGSWMCDSGRVESFKHVNEDRVDSCLVNKDGGLAPVSFEEAAAEAAQRLKKYKPAEIAFIGSAFATCEDNFVFAKFAKNVIGSRSLDFARHLVSGSGDDILMRDDKTPNAAGAILSGMQPGQNGSDINGIMQGIASGKIKALYCLDDNIAALDPAYEQLLSKLELFIVNAVNLNRTAKLASIVFPASSFAEKNGTMINFQNRIQRIRPAVETLSSDRSLDGMSMSRLDKFGTDFDKWAKKNKLNSFPHWKILAAVSSHLNSKMKYNMAEEVFAEMTQQIDALRGLDYDQIGDLGFQLRITRDKSIKNTTLKVETL